MGLPARVATALFAAARNADVPAGWHATDGPLTWELHNTGELLAIGRRLQFEMGTSIADGRRELAKGEAERP